MLLLGGAAMSTNDRVRAGDQPPSLVLVHPYEVNECVSKSWTVLKTQRFAQVLRRRFAGSPAHQWFPDNVANCESGARHGPTVLSARPKNHPQSN
jgi:hypothetical protein